MRTRVLCAFFLLSAIGLQAQDSTTVAADTIRPWKAKGNASFLFNQSTFDNWVSGGENNISGNAGINYDFNYKKGDWSWDNKLIASYGLVKTRTSSFAKKTDDRIEFNSLLGKAINEVWNYSFFLNFKTQFTRGYKYDKDPNGVEIREEYTDFMSPGYLSFGPGISWKKRDDFKFNLSPVASKLTFVDAGRTLPNEAYFGVAEGKSVRYEFGANASAMYKFVLLANVSVENILNLYSNYVEDPQNVDLDYQVNIVLKVNKWLTTNIMFQTIYDDNAFQGFQIRQVFGVAINYGF